ncbi:MAG: hypothetical protein ACI8ZZ_002367 [Gammaproteobacteria bacterium]
MSAYTVINDVSLELRRRIFAAMNSAVGVTLGFTDESTNIVLDPPHDTPDNATRMSLYLYHIGINNVQRNQRLLAQPGRDDEQRLAPLPLVLKYLATPVDDEESNQMVMGRLLQFIYDNPKLDSLDNQPLGDSFGGASRFLRVVPDLLNVEQLTQLWNAFNQPYRLSLAFQVDVVSIDSAIAPVVAPRVEDLIAMAGSKERS